MSRGCLQTSSNEHIIRTNERDGYTQLRWFPSQSDLWLIYVIYGLDSVMWDKQKLIAGVGTKEDEVALSEIQSYYLRAKGLCF